MTVSAVRSASAAGGSTDSPESVVRSGWTATSNT